MTDTTCKRSGLFFNAENDSNQKKTLNEKNLDFLNTHEINHK